MIDKILVAGLINIETTLKIDAFPIDYTPVRYPFFGINTTVSGVGYNVAKALTTLGNRINFLALLGDDFAGEQVTAILKKDNISGRYVLRQLRQTPQSIILYNDVGKRQINVDLKDIQEQTYSLDLFDAAMAECSLVVLCNINFARPFLKRAKDMKQMIATDVHTIADLEDEYNQDFMQAADILFMSNENLPEPPEKWIKKVLYRYNNEIIVIGLGKEGALMSVASDRRIEHIPAINIRYVKNTIGAGDALFSAFIHFYQKTKNPYDAIEKATRFASYKIGETGAAEGFLTEDALNQLYK